jgi:hypothetical protein
MKNVEFIFMAVALLGAATLANAQTLNWNTLSGEQKHIVDLNAGIEYGATIGVGYGYHPKASLPIILNAEFSMPTGNNLMDDFKAKMGVQFRWWQWRSLAFSAEAQGIFRRYKSAYVRLLNFGSDVSGAVGLYRPRWFVAAQAGFDKAIVTHFKHSDLLKDAYPAIKDGWYEPATGGNFYYGLQGGYSFSKLDIYLEAGKIIEQDFKTAPMIPLYARLGWNLKLRKLAE